LEPIRLLYRSLNTPDHLDRWGRGDYHSFHHDAPVEWWVLWKESKSTVFEDYPLQTTIGLFSARAREAFVEVMQKQPDSGKWSKDTWRRVSELAGVCAFETPLGAYKYGTDGDGIPYAQFVEVRGRVLCATPEKGGVVAEVVEVVAGPMSAEAFQVQHRL
jgi:hypothetical protein